MQFFNLHLSVPNWANTAPAASHTATLKGQAYLDGSPIDQHALADQFAAAQNPEQTTALLQRLNGFYAWVSHTADELRAGVDHIRSRPLFYSQKEGRFYISDDAEWVRQRVGDQTMDPLAREEFQLAGYVTGSDTLFPNVKQLQAGEFLVARVTDGNIEVETHRYYRFLHTEPSSYSEPALLAELDAVATRSIQRLIDYAAGRQIVVPLSGGYDSRLIVTLLKRLGYHNVITFTYGVPGNREAEYSRQVAHALGFKWEFVEYSVARWRDAWRSPEAAAYRKNAANHVSLPHVQDWLAIRQLIKADRIEIDAIVVPGHSGDFVAGNHIPAFVFAHNRHTEKDLLDELIKNHLSNASKIGMFLEKNGNLESRLRDRINIPFDGSSVALANLYELWDWQERQSKYIVNSVRVYEQFNLDWWLPLWDHEFVKFWEFVPLALRRERVWFKDWISDQYASHAVNQTDAKILKNAGDPSKIIKILHILAKKLPAPASKFIKYIWRKKPNPNHFLAFEGLVSEFELKKYKANKFNIIGIYSYLYISNKW